MFNKLFILALLVIASFSLSFEQQSSEASQHLTQETEEQQHQGYKVTDTSDITVYNKACKAREGVVCGGFLRSPICCRPPSFTLIGDPTYCGWISRCAHGKIHLKPKDFQVTAV